MSLGIYKPGQGYWVRVLSAVLATLLIAALGVWTYRETGTIVERLPKSEYRLAIEPGQVAPAVGDHIELTARPDSTGAAAKVGVADVASVTQTDRAAVITIRNFAPELDSAGKPKADVASTAAVRKAVDDAKPARTAGNPVGIAPIDPILASTGVASVVGLLCVGLAYWFIGVKPSSVEFLIATDFEMTKVNWSTPREVMGHTWVVIGACFLLALSLWLVDQALVVVFTWMDLLPKVGK
ncbi:MAG: preprotein translocase subunit SecE [Phycisphaerales bacterium]